MRYLQKNGKVKQVKLDVKDKKIVSLLSTDARMPLTQISKKVGLSRDAVSYRIKGFEDKGVIQGYRTIVNIGKFGYDNYHLFIKLNNPSSEAEKKVVAKLVKRPFIRAILKFSGNFDLEIALVAKGVSGLDDVLGKVLSDCNGMIQDYEVLAISKNYVAETFPPNFSGLAPMKKDVVGGSRGKLDGVDIKILDILGEEAQTPLFEIGGKVGLSADAVSYRIKNMIASGVIIKFIPAINYISLGYSLYTFLLNIDGFDAEKENKLKSILDKDRNTLWAVKTIGRYNVLIYLLVKDVADLQETILKLRGLFPKQLNRYEMLIAYEEYKYVYFPKGLVGNP